MQAILSLVRKELTLLRRDWHALLLLFVMPTAFILIMSLALRDTFASHGPSALKYYVIMNDRSEIADQVISRLKANQSFEALPLPADPNAALSSAKAGKAHFVVTVAPGFGAAFDSSTPTALAVDAGPGVEPVVMRLFEAALKEAVSKVYLQKKLEDFGAGDADFGAIDQLVKARSMMADGKKLPSSVQQNVPAWLVFAMFFIAIPLSTTWVQERSMGTLARLKTMGINPLTLIFGKLFPYLIVNLAQVVLMLLIGIYGVPLLGGEKLTLGNSPAGLALMAFSLSIASVSFALLVANLVKSSEQATIFTGVAILLMAALGGIMVPRFIMPQAMQQLSLCSPLAWGLEGFLDIMLREEGFGGVLGWASMLLGFGAASLGLAAYFLGKTRAY